MSSESDPDEFYDAEDVTPARASRSTSLAEDSHESSIFDAIAAEEQSLLDRRRLASERRKEEDDQIERKLEALGQKRTEELEKQEAAMRAERNEKRRQKLLEMREHMGDDGSPFQPPVKPPRTFLYDHAGEEVESGQVKAPDSRHVQAQIQGAETQAFAVGVDSKPPVSDLKTTEKKTEETEDICDIGSTKGDPDLEADSDQKTPEVQETQKPEDREHESQGENTTGLNTPQCSSSRESTPPAPPSGQPESFNVNSPEPDQEKMRPKNIPELLTLESNIEQLEVMSRTRVTPVLEEPDIIQITKSSSLPRSMPVPPVAPPRRKKKNRAPLPPNQLEGCSTSSTQPPEIETPTTTAYSLTEELEKSLALEGAASLTPAQSLDLNSAVKGYCVVTAVEEESAKGGIHALGTETAEPIQRIVAQDSPDGATGTDDKCSEEKVASDEAAEVKGQPDNTGKQDDLDIDLSQMTLNIQRPRTNSGSRYLTDKEILEQVQVLNLDTGIQVPLSQAEDKLPKAINPLSLHIMRRTKEYSSDSSLHRQSDDEDSKTIGGVPDKTLTLKTVKPAGRRKAKIKKLIGKTVHRIRMKADEVFHGEESNSDDDEIGDGRRMIKIKAAHSHKGPYDFDLLVPVQDLAGERTATGGQDNLLRIWVLKDAYSYFDDMRQKYNETKVSPAPSQDSLNSQSENVSLSENTSLADDPDLDQGAENEDDVHAPFMRKPFCVFKGHTADLLDVSWSKNYFVLSSSMDKTVRLWHVSRKECLCCFQHIDFVTAIAFHPKDDRYFLSGSLDGKLRLWNIPDKKVALWNEVSGSTKLITAANFCLNGRFAVVGTYDGRCVFYNTDQLKYFTQIHVRSTRGKNSRGRKITGVEPYPGEDKLLVTSNDSRIRLYDLRDLSLTCKYKGCANNSSQIKASFSSNGRFIVCGSEDHFVYIWRLQHEFYKFSSARRDRNDYWEGIKAHMAVVTTAIFAPQPRLIIKPQFPTVDEDSKDQLPDVRGEVLISADYTGAIKVFINKFKPGSG